MANEKLRALLDKVDASDHEMETSAPKIGAPSSNNNFQTAGASRVDRHNNPIAAIYDKSFTSILDKKQIPYGQGDPFKNQDGSFSTLAFPSPEHGMQGAKAILSESAPAFNWYASATGKKALQEFPNVKTPQDFANLSDNQKDKFVSLIAQSEGTNKFKYQPKDLKGLLDSVGAQTHDNEDQTTGQLQGSQAGFPVPSDVQYDLRTRQPVVTGGQVEPTLGGLVPGINYQQAKQSLPAVVATEAALVAPLIAPALSSGTNIAKLIQTLLSPSGAAVGQGLGNLQDVTTGEQDPIQGLVVDPLKEGGKFLAAELLGKAVLGAPTAYNRFLAGEEGLASKIPGIGRFFQPDAIKKQIAEQAARGAVKELPEKLGISQLKDVKQVTGSKLENTLNGLYKKSSDEYTSVKNPITLKYGKSSIPDSTTNNVLSAFDQQIKLEPKQEVKEALADLKDQFSPKIKVDPITGSKYESKSLNDLLELRDRMNNTLGGGDQTAGAVGKVYDKIFSKKDIDSDSIYQLIKGTSEKDAKAFKDISDKYRDSMRTLSRFEKKTESMAEGYSTLNPGEEIHTKVANDISKNPSLIDDAIKVHPELKEPLADIALTDIANKIGSGKDISKVIDESYHMDRLKEILPTDYYMALTKGIENIEKLNPINKRQAQSKLLIDTILGRNKRGEAGSFIGRAIAGSNKQQE